VVKFDRIDVVRVLWAVGGGLRQRQTFGVKIKLYARWQGRALNTLGKTETRYAARVYLVLLFPVHTSHGAMVLVVAKSAPEVEDETLSSTPQVAHHPHRFPLLVGVKHPGERRGEEGEGVVHHGGEDDQRRRRELSGGGGGLAFVNKPQPPAGHVSPPRGASTSRWYSD